MTALAFGTARGKTAGKARTVPQRAEKEWETVYKKRQTATWQSALLVRGTRLELAWYNHTPLKRARLPIPPSSHDCAATRCRIKYFITTPYKKSISFCVFFCFCAFFCVAAYFCAAEDLCRKLPRIFAENCRGSLPKTAEDLCRKPAKDLCRKPAKDLCRKLPRIFAENCPLHKRQKSGILKGGGAMGFLDSYKKLEKLCGEIYGDEYGVSVYIEEMRSRPDGSYYVPGWEEDLKQLKHYRWVRNKIVHEPNCTEKTMCEPRDTRWIDDFYLRMMSSNDPLAVYYKAGNRRTAQNPYPEQRTISAQNLYNAQKAHSAQNPHPAQKPKKANGPKPTGNPQGRHKKTPSRAVGWFLCLLGILSFLAAAAWIANRIG